MKIPQNPSRYWLEKEIADQAGVIPPNSMVLDAGAGSCIYRKFFDHCVYESADFAKMGLEYPELTYVCELEHIPVEDDRYDFILFSQVLEHLPEPGVVLTELRRVLKPGGRILCSAPLTYQEHGAPYDFYRYTQYGLAHLFTKAGFEIESIHRLEGFYQSINSFLSYCCRNLPKGNWFAKLVFKYYAGVFRKAEMRNKVTDVGTPSNYVVIASRSLRQM